MNFQPDALAYSSDSFFFSLSSFRACLWHIQGPTVFTFPPTKAAIFNERDVMRGVLSSWYADTKHTNASLRCSTGKSSRQYSGVITWTIPCTVFFFLTSNLATAHSVARRSEGTAVLGTLITPRTNCCHPVPTTWRTSHRSVPDQVAVLNLGNGSFKSAARRRCLQNASTRATESAR